MDDSDRERILSDVEKLKKVLQSEESDTDVSDALSTSENFNPNQTSTHNITANWQEDLFQLEEKHHEKEKKVIDRVEQAEKCLNLNFTYQKHIENNLEVVEMMLNLNREKQSKLKKKVPDADANEEVTHLSTCQILKKISIPSLRDSDDRYPPSNEDALMKREIEVPQPYLFQGRKWTKNDVVSLRNAVRKSILKNRLQPYYNKKLLELDKLNDHKFEYTQEEVNKVKFRISELVLQINTIESRRDIQEIFGDLQGPCDDIDWMKISTVDFESEHSVASCQLMWQNAAHPAINVSCWTPDEDRQLKILAKLNNSKNWKNIAKQLKTNRTAFQCLQRYQTKLSPYLDSGTWYVEEDQKLAIAIQNSYVGDEINWRRVASILEKRSTEQCLERWKLLTKRWKIGPWSAKDDAELISAVSIYGFDWESVSDIVKGRSGNQCRERYQNCLDTKLKYGEWNYKEDRYIWASATAAGGTPKWKEMASNLPGRTDNALLQRYRRLWEFKRQRKYVERYEKFIKKDRNLKHDNLKHDNLMKKTHSMNDQELELMRTDIEAGFVVPRPTIGSAISRPKMQSLINRQILHEDIKSNLNKAFQSVCDSKTDISEIATVYNNKLEAPTRAPSKNKTAELHDQVMSKIQQMKGKEVDTSSADMKKVAENIKKILFSRMPRIENKNRIRRIRNSMMIKKSKEKVDACLDVTNQICHILRGKVSKKHVPYHNPVKYASDSSDFEEYEDPKVKEMNNRMLKFMLRKYKADMEKYMHNGYYMKQELEMGSVLQQNERRLRYDDITERLLDLKAISKDTIDYLKYENEEETKRPSVMDKWYLDKILTKDEDNGNVNTFFTLDQLYDIAPLPPQATTLNAYKQLLLNKNSLKKLAAEFYLPGKFDNDVNNVPNKTGYIVSDEEVEKPIEKMPPPDEIKYENLEIDDLSADTVKILSQCGMEHVQVLKNVIAEMAVKKQKNHTISTPENKFLCDPDLIMSLRKKHEYQLFKSRFIATFLWPALLSTIPISSTIPKVEAAESNDYVIVDDKPDEKKKKRRQLKRKRRPIKRKRYVGGYSRARDYSDDSDNDNIPSKKRDLAWKWGTNPTRQSERNPSNKFDALVECTDSSDSEKELIEQFKKDNLHPDEVAVAKMKLEEITNSLNRKCVDEDVSSAHSEVDDLDIQSLHSSDENDFDLDPMDERVLMIDDERVLRIDA